MDEGHYLVTIVSSNGFGTSAQIYVKENQLLGQGLSLSFYGSFHHRYLLLNVAKNTISEMSPILNEYQAYTFSGKLIDITGGYYLEQDLDQDLEANISFTKLSSKTGEPCSTEFID
ncbi:hypothetical protein F3J37_01420 [Pantoea sp. Al-1710]|uniref:Uncharacterized protein n=1 Tax=Candidatus Pantoea communis TaxID=2608354 RepID=A0ABX0RJ21_9GAMM|nr:MULTISPECIES: hypothetical protein [Pantoea]NIG12962.1 hypothetical protein [Pantoea sp. Cy-640]NIG17337.1 hypothetical protein [Pantoea communis]